MPRFLALTTLPLTVAPVAHGGSLGEAPAERIERVPREGLSGEEWVLAMMRSLSATGASAQWSRIDLPPGHALVARVVEDEWRVETLPEDALRAGGGVAPGHDCLNDVRDLESASRYPLTANLLHPVATNVASLGHCTGEAGWNSAVNMLTFRTTGDAGGWVQVRNAYGLGTFEVGCGRSWRGPPLAGGGVGLGAGSVWRTTFEADDTFCYVASEETKPSEWAGFVGSVVNWNYDYGDAFASVVTGQRLPGVS